LCLSLVLEAGTPGSLRFGAVPSGSGAKPALLFVHGWNSDSSTWSGSNDMESKAVGAGYRTAFLDVYPDHSMWDNGPIISGAVDQVKAAYPGASVVLVCHSKGGVDGQTALVYYGGAAKVERLITLSSPHRGTPLADLAWSSWAGWLAGLLGVKSEGNRVLQTGYMASFRAQTDALAASRVVPTYTAGGTKAGPLFSEYWFGGIAIGRTSDGVVPLDSSDLPYQRARLFTRSWNHEEVKQGSNAWPYIQASLATAVAAVATPASRLAAATSSSQPGLALDRLYRGGATVSGMAECTFPVDAGQPELQAILQTAHAPRWVVLISPSGHLHTFQPGSRKHVSSREPVADENFDEANDMTFPGAVNRQVHILHPEAGLWRMQFAAQGEDAYFFTGIFPGDALQGVSAVEALGAVHGRTSTFAAAEGRSAAVHSVRTPASASFMKALKSLPIAEPTVVNHTLVLTWPGGRERAVIFSEAE
jgi:triacylglycerol lipase